jgi:hypothetical protein
MWPTLRIGAAYLVLARGWSRSKFAVLLGIDLDGTLMLALSPASPRRRWLPLTLDRGRVRGVFGPRS